ncbi:NADPH-dependent FMN reductase [Aminipila terrae]|uniref:NADPH-dependent FMN reductase n=1 Tax=Aminipila terrae TaxID=2697030 RepID=A0A6P1MRJ5_9FIRM|nr:NAD(P)H-dependent oxidoreductase [Aminipila terrae]QHI73615.1 NADPH-dependent FMN reductase [Aminipila terrae]
MDKVIKIVGFTGSLRRNSYNKAALRAAQMLLPENAVLDILDLAEIPFLNEDLEAQGLPASVADFKKTLSEADAILISTPEYNFSIPPVLKNALDWASRGEPLPLYGKPLAIMSASPSMLGGARVQYHLRQVCVSLNLIPLNKPEVFIANANTKFDEAGNLTDERTRKSIEALLKALVQNV